MSLYIAGEESYWDDGVESSRRGRYGASVKQPME